MNKNIFRVFFLSVNALFLFCACKRDLGNYTYSDINELIFTNIDTVNGYSIDLGDTLDISPQINASIDKSLSGSYSYEWKLLRNPANGTETTLSREKNLHLFISYQPDIYSLSFNVTDNTTGVTFRKRMPMTVTTPLYEGWLILNKVADTSRLDFLSFRNNDFVFHKNITGELNTGLPGQGEPYQVLYGYSLNAKNLRGVFLSTASGTTILDPENLSYSPDRNLSTFMLGNAPADFKADHFNYIKGSYAFADAYYMYSNGNYYLPNIGLFAYNLPYNIYHSTGQTFKASPYSIYVADFILAVMYDEDNRQFAFSNPRLTSPNMVGLGADIGFPTGMDLLYMSDNNISPRSGTNYCYSVLHDPGTGKFYMLRFSFANYAPIAPDYYQEITATNFAQAEFYAMSPNLNYLFYTIGSKVYEYDLFAKTTKLMLDKGSEKISLMVFDTNRKPDDWANSLSIASYDPNGPSGSNGTLIQYSVPPVNGNLVEQFRWSGFGEIKSISYRFRATY